MRYRYPHFQGRLLLEDLRFATGPKPGAPMPDFDLPTTEGGRIRKTDVVGRTPLVLAFGSITCPMTADADPKLIRLHDEFGDRVAFVLLYVREAHPGDRYPQPETFEQKLDHARDLQGRDRLPFAVAVDGIDGELHRELDTKPNAVYIMDKDGNVAFRGLWANDREGVLRDAIEKVARGESPARERTGRMIPMMRGVAHMDETLELAGPTARRDVRRGAPPVYAMARLVGMVRRAA